MTKVTQTNLFVFIFFTLPKTMYKLPRNYVQTSEILGSLYVRTN